MRYPRYIKPIIILCLIAILATARANYDSKQDSIPLPTNYSSTPAILMQLIWGQVQGLGADFTLLKAFSIYYDANQADDIHNVSWQALSDSFFLAQTLDPQFYDTYHIGLTTLAYDAKRPEEAIKLAYMGSNALPLNWQIPFIGGFIAYDINHDYHEAAKLMSLAAHVPEAPSLAVTLASRFLKNDVGTDAAITFLKKMLNILPKEYQTGIKTRLKTMNENKHEK